MKTLIMAASIVLLSTLAYASDRDRFRDDSQNFRHHRHTGSVDGVYRYDGPPRYMGRWWIGRDGIYDTAPNTPYFTPFRD